MRHVILDVETMKSFDEVGGYFPEKLGVSFVGVIERETLPMSFGDKVKEQRYELFENDIKSLSEQLAQAKEHIKLLSDDLVNKNRMLAEGKSLQQTVTIEQIKELLQNMLQTSEAEEIRPKLNDKVFIDPTGGKVLIGSEITIEGDVSDRNVMDDLEKLRNLLGKK